MLVLLESNHEGFIEHLQQQLSLSGIDCHVLALGRAPDGERYFAIQLARHRQMSQARQLLYRDRRFALRIDPVFATQWQALREAPKQQLLHWLTSPLALYISGLCGLILVLGSLAEWLWR